MTPKLTPEEFTDNLRYFYGSEYVFQHSLNPKMLYTEGVQYFAEQGGAYWLLDIIATEVMPLQKEEEFINLVVTVRNSKAALSGDDGNGNVIYLKLVDYTDLQEGEWRFYLTGNTLMLPSEY